MAIKSYGEVWSCRAVLSPTHVQTNRPNKLQHLQLKKLNSGVLLSSKIWQSLSRTGLGFSVNWEPANVLWLRLYSSLGCFEDVKWAQGNLRGMIWHFSHSANRIRKVVNCHWRFWYLLIKKTICKQYMQPAVAICGAVLFGWQSCLISSTQNLHCLFSRLSHPGLPSCLDQQLQSHRAGMDVHF